MEEANPRQNRLFYIAKTEKSGAAAGHCRLGKAEGKELAL